MVASLLELRVDVAVDSVAAVNLNGVGFQRCGPFNLASCRAIPVTPVASADFNRFSTSTVALLRPDCRFEAFCSFEMRFGIACSVCR